jgi:8-oxo-dGTP diphosphatase
MRNDPRVGVGVIIRRGDEVLLLHRAGGHGSGSWSTPGGHLDHGETLEQCAIREVMEETGVEIHNVRFRALTNDVFAREGRHYLTVWMDADYRSGEARVNAAHEMSSVAWFPWDRLPAPLFLPLENLLGGRCYPPSASVGVRAQAR